MLTPGRRPLDPDDVPEDAEGAVLVDVDWFDRNMRPTDDPDRVAELLIVYRREDGSPTLTVYGVPDPT